jgi:hypothetical protein
MTAMRAVIVYITFQQSDDCGELALDMFVHVVFSGGGSMAKNISGL